MMHLLHKAAGHVVSMQSEDSVDMLTANMTTQIIHIDIQNVSLLKVKLFSPENYLNTVGHSAAKVNYCG